MILRTVRNQISDKRVQSSVFGILGQNVLCSMSTVGPKNRAHINTAYFAYSPELELYFLSDSDSRHCRNLLRNPSMAIAVFSSSQEWSGHDRGIQLFGTCRRPRGRDAERAEHAYGDRFAAYGEWLRGTREADRTRVARLRSYAFYRFLPTDVKILDEREFGAVFVVASVPTRGDPESARRSRAGPPRRA